MVKIHLLKLVVVSITFSPGTGNFKKTTVQYLARIDQNGVGKKGIILDWAPICLIHLHMVHQVSVSNFLL